MRFIQADTLSGHHYSWLEGAAIGHDFGRNPWSRDGTEGFAGARGRAHLRAALARAVVAGETAMSFDFAFDLRSIVELEGPVGLDAYALAAVAAFLAEIEEADAAARLRGRFFRADVVLFDFRLADGEVVDERYAASTRRSLTTGLSGARYLPRSSRCWPCSANIP